jgi:hypothetical protein
MHIVYVCVYMAYLCACISVDIHIHMYMYGVYIYVHIHMHVCTGVHTRKHVHLMGFSTHNHIPVCVYV